MDEFLERSADVQVEPEMVGSRGDEETRGKLGSAAVAVRREAGEMFWQSVEELEAEKAGLRGGVGSGVAMECFAAVQTEPELVRSRADAGDNGSGVFTEVRGARDGQRRSVDGRLPVGPSTEGQECRRLVAGASAAQVEAEALGSMGDDASGVFSEEERRAWWQFHETDLQGSKACSVDAGWQAVCHRRCGVVQHAASCLHVGPAFDAVQDVRLVSCGSRLGDAFNKCFQVAVLRCFERNMDFARSSLCVRLQHVCNNDAGSSFFGCGLERRNLEETTRALKECGWVCGLFLRGMHMFYGGGMRLASCT